MLSVTSQHNLGSGASRSAVVAALLVAFCLCSELGVRGQASPRSLTCRCEGPHFCKEGNRTCDLDPGKGHVELFCVSYKVFYDDGVVAVGATCKATEITYFLLWCHPPKKVVPETRNGVTWKSTVSRCCTTDYCNTKEALDEYIAELDPTDLPPTGTPTLPYSPTDGVTSNISTTATTSSPPTTSSSQRTNTTTSPPPETPVYAVVIIVILSLTVVVIVAVIVVVLALHYLPHHFSQSVKGSGSSMVSVSFPVDSSSYSDPSLNELLEDSGSGSGLPLLIQRSISGQITLHNLIGKGRFGEVWKGTYKGDFVAVKIFHTKEELSWFHEVEVYQTCLLRHPNVLRFIAADNRDVGLQMQLWLITDYCEYGSLFELLSRTTFPQATALKLCHTAASGLDHLHTEIVGAQRKPAIAHRDLKSRNILVKGDFSCCIADLGLSLTYEQATGEIKNPPRTTVGTRRYLAPEVLTESISAKNFESFKRSDIYSFGLVMWEIGRRAQCEGYAEEAQLPYFDLIPSDPTLEEVQRVVCVERRRPSLPNPWNQHEAMAGLSRIIQQCWLHEADARLTSLRIKKSLAILRELLKERKESDQL